MAHLVLPVTFLFHIRSTFFSILISNFYFHSCMVCGQVLSGEYMGKDGQPYCEKDYQKSFGVKCAYCERYISGKVLQAGDNHHFHPTCARCSKCGDPFGDGEEMYLQGTAIWVS
jgi:actin-binding LIM protein